MIYKIDEEKHTPNIFKCMNTQLKMFHTELRIKKMLYKYTQIMQFGKIILYIY